MESQKLNEACDHLLLLELELLSISEKVIHTTHITSYNRMSFVYVHKLFTVDWIFWPLFRGALIWFLISLNEWLCIVNAKELACIDTTRSNYWRQQQKKSLKNICRVDTGSLMITDIDTMCIEK